MTRQHNDIRVQAMSDDLLVLHSHAIFSPCGTWRYLLEREVSSDGLVFAFFGVNGSTAGAKVEDQTTKKWRGFTLRNGGRYYLAANPFAYCAKDVRELAKAADPVGPANAGYLRDAIGRADVLVPCWGSREKVPERLRHHFDDLLRLIFAAGKPVKTFGFTNGGDPKHPLMLGYDTPLVEWSRP